MNEKPLERLNYFNGQRLEAADLKTEQDYHIRTRRWLNKSLYSAGIAAGLDVREANEGPFVIVGSGMAIDDLGREIILLEQETVEVCSYSGTNESTVVGNYLVIEYAEDKLAYDNGAGCAPRESGKRASTSTTNKGGPSRVVAKPKFSWLPFPPHPNSNQIALARVELVPNSCDKVHQIDLGIRNYIGAASTAKVRQYALEGEKEVACLPELDETGALVGKNNITTRIYFHIRGRQPTGVTLYLRAEELSKLHYTEMGFHQHTLTVGTGVPTSAPIYDATHPEKYTHSHTLNIDSLAQKAFIGNESEHKHAVLNVAFRGAHSGGSGGRDTVLSVGGLLPLETPVYDNILPPLSWPGGRITGYGGTIGTDAQFGPPFTAAIEGATAHTHSLTGTTDPKETKDDHTHTFTPTLDLGSAGVADSSATHAYSARTGAPLTFVSNLKIAIDGFDKSAEIRAQIVDSVADQNQKTAWAAGIGNGTSNHPLANKAIDATPIRLDFLPHVVFGEGQHFIEFSVDLLPNGEANGGKILYNLYVE